MATPLSDADVIALLLAGYGPTVVDEFLLSAVLRRHARRTTSVVVEAQQTTEA